jgi:DNA-binding MarR family transcriptional regulator
MHAIKDSGKASTLSAATRSAATPVGHNAARGAAEQRRFDSLAQEAYLNLWRSYDRLRAVEDELFSSHDLTPQQYNVLRLLRGVHPATLRTLELAARLVSRAPDITRMLDHLQKRGLIQRERLAENRRVVRVGITAGGLALLKQLDAPVRACHQQQLGHLGPEQLRTLINLLEIARQPHEEAESTWARPALAPATHRQANR